MPMARKPTPDKNVVSMADAQRDLARQRRRRNDPPPKEARGGEAGEGGELVGGAPPGQWTPNNLGLPVEDECPVQPLGHEPGRFHFIDSMGQFTTLTPSDFSHAGLTALFASTPNYPQWAWPRYGRSAKAGEAPPIKSFDDDHCRTALMRACSRRGLFSPADKLRGRGMWCERGGGLIYHAGEELWTLEVRADKPAFRAAETGLREGFLYPRLPSLPAPVAVGDDPVPTLLRTFSKWNFEGPRLGDETIPVAAVLLLGWIGVAFLGGALDWRSAILLLGDKGTGKSTLQKALQDLFGDALFHSGDTTAAGIYQKMGHDARPVAVDELEPDADPRKVDAVVRLMRVAASGESASRGGSNHQGVEFTLRSAFLFSAINNPLVAAQDLSRVAILRLRELVPGQEMPAPIDADLCGRILLGRLMAAWPRFEATRDEYMRALAAGGHNGRGQKTYGTLLAAADLLIGSDVADALGIPLVSTDGQAAWAQLLAAESLPEIEDASALWRNCLTWLLTAHNHSWKNGRHFSIGAALDDLVAPLGEGGYTLDQARRDLASVGVGLMDAAEFEAKCTNAIARADNQEAAIRLTAIKDNAKKSYVLAVPSKRRASLMTLFAETPWAQGSWKDALRTGPPDIVVTDKAINKLRVGGVEERCTLIIMRRFNEAPER